MPNDEKTDAQVEKELKRVNVAFRRCFGTDSGRVVMDHLEKTFNETTSFVPGDSHRSAWNEGRRALYLEMKSLAESKGD